MNADTPAEDPGLNQALSTKHIAWLILLVSMLCVLVFLIWKAYQAGQRQGGYGMERANHKIEQQQKLLEKQEQMIAKFRNQSIASQRAAQIEAKASREAQKEIIMLENELAESRAEADLLRSLKSENQLSLYVKKFKLKLGDEDQSYRYQFILAQALEGAGITKGTLVMEIIGRQDGVLRTLGRSSFSADGKKTVELDFKHYQKIDGTIRLPLDFVPEAVRIEVRPKNRKSKNLTRKFIWQLDNS